MLEYTLEENKLTDAPADYRAQVVNVRSYTQNDIIDRILDIGAGLTRSDVLSVLEAEKQVIRTILADGGAVNTELFNASPSISGVFTGAVAPFTHANHKISVNLHAGSAIRDSAAHIKVKQVPPSMGSRVMITEVSDAKSGTVNDKLSPDFDVKIHGIKLKIAGDDPSTGLFFLNIAKKTRTKVDPLHLIVNNPSEIIARIPALVVGTYRIEIVTQFSGSGGKNRTLSAPHTFTFDKILTVG